MPRTYWDRKLWEPDVEAMPRKELRKLQEKKLFRQLIYAYENAPLYKELYDKEKVNVYRIRTIDDFQKYVPLIDKDMLRAYRERTGDIFGGILCLPLTRKNFSGEHPFAGKLLHSTGTTGMPTYQICTETDLNTLGNFIAREWWREGVRPGDFILSGFGGIDVLSWHLMPQVYEIAYRKVGAFFYECNMFNPGPDLDVMMLLQAQGADITFLFTGIPEFRWLVRKLEQEGKNLKRDYFPKLKCVTHAGELSKSLVDYGCQLFGVVTSTHSTVTETHWGGGACMYGWEEGDGARMYIHEPEDTHFIEIFPPGLDKPVDEAEFGEAIITNLFSQAMAYIRWRSEDWAQVRYDPCHYCGYTHMQCRIKSRVSESVNIGGKTITMGDVEDILYAHPESRPLPAQLIREEPQPQDKLRLRVCYNDELVKDPEQYKLKLVAEFEKNLGVATSIDLITPGEVKTISHKYERVIKEKR